MHDFSGVVFQTDSEIADACGVDPSLICEKVYDWSNSEIIARLVDWALGGPAKIILIVLGAWFIRRISLRLIDRLIERLVVGKDEISPEHETLHDGWRGPKLSLKLAEFGERAERSKQRARTLGVIAKSTASIAIVTIAILMVLGELNINLAPLIAGAGIIGVAIGFGAQSLVKDILSGIFMLIEDQYGVGDVIDVGEAIGSVEEVGLRTTRIRSVDGTLWHVPNGEIRRVGNMSQLWAKAVLDVEVAYDTDLDLAMKVIKDAADAIWHANEEHLTILEEPQVQGVQNFGADAVAIRVVIKTEPAEQWDVARLLRRRLKDAFDAAGIEIPFPQRTVWLRTESPEE
ncbi:MAG: small-conductance mechanosensitive channel [Candidatus Poriferisodalaceae bacterium]